MTFLGHVFIFVVTFHCHSRWCRRRRILPAPTEHGSAASTLTSGLVTNALVLYRYDGGELCFAVGVRRTRLAHVLRVYRVLGLWRHVTGAVSLFDQGLASLVCRVQCAWTAVALDVVVSTCVLSQ